MVSFKPSVLDEIHAAANNICSARKLIGNFETVGIPASGAQ